MNEKRFGLFVRIAALLTQTVKRQLIGITLDVEGSVWFAKVS